ncbi:hypothetical protein [Symbioplanes lichenis]|uniref:hypothetical protein n=1 Tax=Symbioplanes lichenis TaxID=1629072 RepID=UPI002739AEC8|nr:hypothetical protein [Actinoplanes lichenis]
MRYRAAAAGAALATAAALVTTPGAAAAVEPGFEVKITELPATFGAGAEARTLTVVVSSDRNRCIKVQWSLLAQVDGPDLDDLRVTRIEENGEFGVRRQEEGKVARITDRELDPGQLCRGRTVTATYRISFDEDADTGRVLFQPQAFTQDGTLLQETSGTSPVVGQEPAATKSPSPSPTAEPSPSETSLAPIDTPEPEKSADDIEAVPAAGGGGPPSLLGPGLIVGALLVFVGVALLLRLRMRSREAERQAAALPTGFYPSR